MKTAKVNNLRLFNKQLTNLKKIKRAKKQKKRLEKTGTKVALITGINKQPQMMAFLEVLKMYMNLIS